MQLWAASRSVEVSAQNNEQHVQKLLRALIINMYLYVKDAMHNHPSSSQNLW